MADLFEGHEPRDCGEHRATIKRAWCFDCSEWCYEIAPCKGCAQPVVLTALRNIAQYHPDWKGQHVNNAPDWRKMADWAFHALQQVGEL